MRFILLIVLLLASCMRATPSTLGLDDGANSIGVGLSVTEQRSEGVVEKSLVRALQNHRLTVGLPGDSVDYLIIVVAECLPSRQRLSACGDSTQVAFGLWSVAPAAERVESGYVPAGFRSEQSGVVRLASEAVAGWLATYVERANTTCFDRERVRRGIAPVRKGRRDYRDDAQWSCRLTSGRARVP